MKTIKSPLQSGGILFLLIGGMILLMLMNMAWGSVAIPMKAVARFMTGGEIGNVIWENIIWRTRLPQTLVAAGAGMALGVAGLLMQTLFRNPLAGPSVLGVSSGASLGVAFVMLLYGQIFGAGLSAMGFWGDAAVTMAAFLGALGELLLVLLISRKVGGTLGVLIMGVMIGYLSNSIVGMLKYFSLEEEVHNYVIWGLGSFSRLPLNRAIGFFVLTASLSLSTVILSKPLNLIAMGDLYAQSLGVNTSRARFLIILCAGLLTASVAAFCGPIIFIGLAVPHLSKMLSATSNHFVLIVNTAFMGGTVALLCNLIARLPGLEMQLPVNSVTAFVGAPVVISVILKRKMERS